MTDKRFYTIVATIAFLGAGLIAWGILNSQWKAEAVKLSLDRGQNPLYAKCAMQSSATEECNAMIMAMSLSGQFKDATAPVAIPPAQKK
jgi:hypothetical protein